MTPTTTPTTDTAVEQLSHVLWRERELLGELQYALEVEQLVLASGRNRWLMRSATQVEAVLEDLRRTEVLRATAAHAAGTENGLGPEPSLQQLAAELPDPWGEIYGEHREALLRVTAEITALADSNRELITSGYRSARETLMNLGETTQGYTADGAAVTTSAPPVAVRVDRTF